MTSEFRAAWQLIKPYWASTFKWRALLTLIVLLCFSVAAVRVQVYVNGLNKSFYDALQQFDKKLIIHFALIYVGMVLIGATLTAMYGYIAGRLTNHWRRFLTDKLVDKWLNNKAYYQMNLLGQGVDNPDQRISDDVDSLTSMSLNLFMGLFTSLLQLVTFSVLTWQLGGTLHFSIHNTHIAIPGYYFWSVLLYAVLNTLITMLIGSRLSHLNYQQQHFTADFRFGLMRLREYGEQIALSNGERHEKSRLTNIYRPIYNNFLNILAVARNLTFFTSATETLSLMLGIVFALPTFFHSKGSIGNIMQMTSAFSYTFTALSFIVNAYAQIAQWRAVIHRLAEFNQKIDFANQHERQLHHILNQDYLSMQDITVYLPDGKPLQANLDLSIPSGERVLITGNSGTGKSTLLRTIAGIWPHAEGNLTLPQGKTLFLSQKPYLSPGRLIDALCFPDDSSRYSQGQIIHYLYACGLDHLVPLVESEVERNWHLELSLGEQQKCAIIRALLQRPDWLFLDEASASLDEEAERKIYQLLDTELPSTTIISIGHRQSLKQLHHRTINIAKE